MTSNAAWRSTPFSSAGAPLRTGKIAGIDSGPERRASPPVGAPRVGVAIEEQLRDGELPVRERHDERSDAVRIGAR